MHVFQTFCILYWNISSGKKSHMNTLFYVTSPADIKFSALLASEYKQLLCSSDVFAFTHTSSMKDSLQKLADGFKEVLSESECIANISDSDLTQEEESLLHEIEERTKSTIWKFIYQDRWLSMRRRGFLYKDGTKHKRNELLKIIIYKFKYIEEFVLHRKIKKIIFVTQDFGTSSASILFEISKFLKIKIICPTISKFHNYFFLNDTIYSEVFGLEKQFKKVSSQYDCIKIPNQVKELHGQIISGNKSAYSVPTKKRATIRYFLKIFQYFYRYYFKGYFRDPKQTSPILYSFDKLYSIINKFYIEQIFSFDHFSAREKYVYFPLHLEPELVLLLHAPFYSDQISIIKNIAKSLPADTVLIVKDHPIAMGRRKLSFYKMLKKIPNIKVISPKINSSTIIKNCLGVCTITGTTGIEAFYLKKPVITFGNVFYNFLDCVVNIKNFEELPFVLANFDKYIPTEDDIYKYLVALTETAHEIDLLGMINTTSSLEKSEFHRYKSKMIENYAKLLLEY